MRVTFSNCSMMQDILDLFSFSPFLAGIISVLLIVLAFLFFVKLYPEVLSKEDEDGSDASALSEDREALFLALINKGNELLGQYEFDKALAQFQEALKLKSGDAAVHFKVGRIFLQKEDFRNAITAFKNVINLNPNQVEARYELARIYQQEEKFHLAHEELSQALKINPEHEETLKLKIKLFEQEGHYQQALPILLKLMETSRQSKRYRIQYAEFLARLQKHEEAINQYMILIDRDPNNEVQYQGKIGHVYFEMGNYAKAIEYYQLVIENSGPESNDLTLRNQMAAALCNEGVSHFNTNDTTRAIQYYKEALKYDAENPDIHFNLAKAYAEVKDINNAIKHYEEAVQLNPRDISSYYELAVLQDNQGYVKEAIASYEKVLDLNPKHLKAIFGLGTLYGVQGNLEQSIHYLTQAIKLDPMFVDAIYNLGVALERQKNFNKAIQMYKKVLNLDGAHIEAKSNLAHLQHTKGQR